MCKNKGFIPISRCLFDHNLWKEKRVFSKFEAWIYIIKEARFEKTSVLDGYIKVEIDRGQLYASLRFLAKSWGWSRSKVSRFLCFLRENKMIETRKISGTGQSLLTVCNYDTYNDQRDTNRDSTVTASRQHRDSTVTKSNKVNKDNKERIKKNTKKKGRLSIDEYDYSDLPEQYVDAMKKWVEYKVDRGESYTPRGWKAHCTRMKNNYGKDKQGAEKIEADVMFSISNNYAGIYEDKMFASKANAGSRKTTTIDFKKSNITNWEKVKDSDYDERF